jgi:hypothetical protein
LSHRSRSFTLLAVAREAHATESGIGVKLGRAIDLDTTRDQPLGQAVNALVSIGLDIGGEAILVLSAIATESSLNL